MLLLQLTTIWQHINDFLFIVTYKWPIGITSVSFPFAVQFYRRTVNKMLCSDLHSPTNHCHSSYDLRINHSYCHWKKRLWWLFQSPQYHHLHNISSQSSLHHHNTYSFFRVNFLNNCSFCYKNDDPKFWLVTVSLISLNTNSVGFKLKWSEKCTYFIIISFIKWCFS